MIGTTLAGYEIIEKLGAGGMGVVFKARDLKLGRIVAVKCLPPELGESDESRQRFLREARAAAALDHPNICTIYQIAEADGRLFLVMAYYRGETLQQRIARGALPLDETLDLLRQIAAGLAAAHSSGIIHRDIKPANVFITERGEAKILDFGLARVAESTRLTRTGAAMGTLAYMPPEQLRAEETDRRADIWSLGVTLYEMLTGRLPFPATNQGALVNAILTLQPEPPSAIRQELPGWIDRPLARALAKRTDDRYTSVGQLVDDLDRGGDAPAATPVITSSGAPTAVTAATETQTALTVSSVAVADFANISGNPSSDWLSAGIAETVNADLRKVSALKLTERRKVLAAAAGRSAGDSGELGRRLGVRWLVWGTHQQLGEAVRITANLTDVAAGELALSLKLDGTMGQIFALQDRIVTGLLEVLGVKPSDTEAREIERPGTQDLRAWEHCARARQLVNRMSASGFVEAKEHLEKAIAIDPGYASAYSTLGMMFGMRFIATTDTADLDRAVGYLERATELDPTIADPHAWLSYAYARLGRYEAAVAAGRRAATLEDDHPFGHYFLGVAHWLKGVAGMRPVDWPEAVRHLEVAARLVPRFQPAPQILGDVHLRLGRYREAQAAFESAARIEESGDYELSRFVGGIALLATVHLRRGEVAEAAVKFELALGVSGKVDHVYTPAVTAQAHCGAADVALRRRRPDDAVRAFGRAIEIGRARPRALGIGWPVASAHFGLARAFRRLQLSRDEKDAVRRADEILERRSDYDFSGIWEGGPGALHFERARYECVAGRIEPARRALVAAVEHGWLELPRLQLEPDLECLRGDPALDEIRQRVVNSLQDA